MSASRERVDAIGGVVEAPTSTMWPHADPAALKWPGEAETVRAAYDAQIRAALHGAQPADARDLFDRVRAVDPALARRVAHELAGGERP